jgi:C-3',4' desaturase CrtD
MYDYIVLGAGYGGLATSALLAKRGFKTLLLEQHSTLGGCASFFRRKQFTFDVGATTLSGVLPHQPLGRLFSELDISPKLHRCDPGMIIALNNNESSSKVTSSDDSIITRYANPEQWIEECTKRFSDANSGSALRLRKFWDEMYQLEKRVWKLTGTNHRLPIRSVGDLISGVKLSNIPALSLLPGLVKPILSRLQYHGLDSNKRFCEFIDEQLLISTQNPASKAPYLTGAMGLTYPSETYYPFGGIYAPALQIQRAFRAYGGETLYRSPVTDIRILNGIYVVSTPDETYSSKGIVSNIPIWNMAKLTHGSMQDYFAKQSSKFSEAWGAVTVYFAVKNTFAIQSPYYQIHIESPLPYCASKSIFVTFSMDGDTSKAPDGWRTVTVSTHAHTTDWKDVPHDEYVARKQAIEERVIQEIARIIPEVATAEKEFISSGTPHTFERYTSRKDGFVGGIPHSIERNFLMLPPNATPFKNFFMVGDSVFPGQGTPAVVLGALNIVQRISG